MILPIIITGYIKGFSSIPYFIPTLKVALWIALVALLKYFFGGARNKSERVRHGKVVMVTVCQPQTDNATSIDTASRVVHQESGQRLLKTLLRAALKSSFSLITNSPISFWSTTSKTYAPLQTTNSSMPNMLTSPPSTRFGCLLPNGSTMPLLDVWT